MIDAGRDSTDMLGEGVIIIVKCWVGQCMMLLYRRWIKIVVSGSRVGVVGSKEMVME
jgi:hypothetical protein